MREARDKFVKTANVGLEIVTTAADREGKGIDEVHRWESIWFLSMSSSSHGVYLSTRAIR